MMIQPIHARAQFEKGTPRNLIPKVGIQRIADTLIGWKEEETALRDSAISQTEGNWQDFHAEEAHRSRIVDLAELKKNDYNSSPSRYIHTGDADLSTVALAKQETYRPIGEIVAELDAIEAEAKETDRALREILAFRPNPGRRRSDGRL